MEGTIKKIETIPGGISLVVEIYTPVKPKSPSLSIKYATEKEKKLYEEKFTQWQYEMNCFRLAHLGKVEIEWKEE